VKKQKKRILFFFSDTGGGHRSAAEAIREAFYRDYGDHAEIVMVDAFKDATPFPVNQTPKIYLPLTTYAEFLWAAGFAMTDNRFMRAPSRALIDLVAEVGLRRVLRDQAPDLVVNDHPIFTGVIRNAVEAICPQIPFVTVVTDLFTAHQLWYDPKTDLTIVPTDGAREVGKHIGMPNDKMQVVGLPVSLKFLGDSKTKEQHRAELGLAQNMRTALMVGGGEGMGKLYDIARAINDAKLPLQLVIIAGRNKALKEKLEQAAWQIPVSIQGFVRNMPDWMRASDVIITKAGPGTICEAIACGLPIILSGFLPGQEEGNVTFVVKGQVGVLCREPADIARTLGTWLEPGNDMLEHYAKRAHELARPNAALDIAKILHDMLVT
jgi:1,2-diacylglycerol 3-beta-galactosyltransferase